MNKSIKIFLIVVVAFLYTSIFNLVNASYYIEDYKINAKLKDDGNVKIEEYIKYNFIEDMNGLRRTILYNYSFKNQPTDVSPTSSRYQAKNIIEFNSYVSDNGFDDLKKANLKLESELSNGMQGFYSLTKNNEVQGEKTLDIKLYSPVKSNESKYVKYEYEIEDVLVGYNNATEFFWNFIGKSWDCEIKNLKINISWDTYLNSKDIIVYAHSRNQNVEVTKDNSINIATTNLPANKPLDARIILPSNILSYSKNTLKNLNENYNYETLKKLEEDLKLADKKYNISSYVYLGILLISILNFIYILILISKYVNNNKKKLKNVEYVTQIPENYDLCECSTILYRYNDFSSSQLLLSTILDLVDKKYILMNCQKKSKVDFFERIEYDYYLKLNLNKDYSILTKYEIVMINLLFLHSIDEQIEINKFENKEIELNDSIKKIAKKTKLINKFKEQCLKYNQEYISKVYTKERPEKISKFINKSNLLIAILVIINIVFIVPFSISDAVGITILAIVSLVIYTLMLLVAKYSITKLKPEYMEKYNELIGIKKYLKDYSLIKQRYPIEIALWDKYLVFASIFGMSDKVAKEFKEELLKQGIPESDMYINNSILNMSINSMIINNSISTNINIASSSSGGYSGGSSGGGRTVVGGGRRSFLKKKNKEK